MIDASSRRLTRRSRDTPCLTERTPKAADGDGDLRTATAQLAELVSVGVDEVIVNLPLIKSVDAIHTAAEVLRTATA